MNKVSTVNCTADSVYKNLEELIVREALNLGPY